MGYVFYTHPANLICIFQPVFHLPQSSLEEKLSYAFPFYSQSPHGKTLNRHAIYLSSFRYSTAITPLPRSSDKSLQRCLFLINTLPFTLTNPPQVTELSFGFVFAATGINTANLPAACVKRCLYKPLTAV